MKKFILHIIILTFLTGCLQSTSMLGPTMTLVTTGNVGHALGAYATNKAVEEETGMQTHQLLVKKVEAQKLKSKRKSINLKLINLIESNIKKTRQIIYSN
tara:strand:- start:385 stop:684 length:300 start_codon:yes stop_codon:yes gene_type:complete